MKPQTERELDDAQRAELRRELMRSAVWPTEEEDAAITAAALADPDNPPLKEGEGALFKPARLFGGKLQAANVVVQSKKPPR
ncbi:hypothetical protein [Pseudoduganella rhizocola]|uniref:hypothetical protein n=1 Tax=Pseudoduganella rhizocola TaxID=3382643 RepID=UPI0038B4BB56